jgi:uroporphyrin-III C-methyltransferase/precorrin-2 dehydrogenase/sirohydrochlorin ferrochelatase/uroporphyrin-III C-methyltransferase
MSDVNVYLVGAGPGDPELLTIKAYNLLNQAEIILYDSLVDPRVLALARRGARLIGVGKRCGRHSIKQSEICERLVAEARTGALTVRLKGGDPMVFGRATEEMEALTAAGIAFAVIPGITTATAAAASLAKSLTQRGVSKSLHFLTGHGAQNGLPAHDWVALTKSGGTLAIYMGGQTVHGLATHFIEAGMSPEMPAVAVENVSLPSQRMLTGSLAMLPRLLENAAFEGPVLILIGAALSKAKGLRPLDPHWAPRAQTRIT